MQIIVDKARQVEEKEESVVKVPLQKTVSAGIRKSFPTCTLKEVLFPQKYEKLTLLFYILVAPFVIGHLFLFTYVSGFSFSVYAAVNAKNTMFLTWCLGYEIFTVFFFISLAIFSLRQASKYR
ncbi:MAG: hypothetical protein GQ531_05860 [Sulfurovum sp.]|nr:hypothetical protein [Sulfurovum sp.]